SRILRTDNLSAAIPSPGSKSAGKDGLRGEGVQRRRRQPAWSTSTETAGQLAPKRVVRFDRNGWSAWSETSGQIGAKYAHERMRFALTCLTANARSSNGLASCGMSR